MHSLLTQPLLTAEPLGRLTLPGVLAALARDEIDHFPALRPHQGMFWHMFCVQLAALALHGADRTDIPQDEETWRGLLRGLTRDFPDDEPWSLVVDDPAKPAFMQPPIPDGVTLKNDVVTPDALDLLITSKNHDLKQAVARDAEPEDWIFALVSLQTGEGYGGAGNQGIARMNGGSSSRPLLALAPLPAGGRAMTPRPGAWFRRDLRILLDERPKLDALDFPERGGLGLTWLAPWPEGAQLRTRELDPWFVEVCRRVRLREIEGRIGAVKGTTGATRVDAKHLKGNLGDPWAPIHKTEGKAFTLGDEGDFTYGKLVELLFSGEWELPLLARKAPSDAGDAPLAMMALALARGNSKTGGFRSRCVPLRGERVMALSFPDRRKALHAVAQEQTTEIAEFKAALAYALVLASVGGEPAKITRDSYAHAERGRARLDRYADGIFFEHLWRRFEAGADDARKALKRVFVMALWTRTKEIFDAELPAMPCSSLMRPRAETRARRALRGKIMKRFSDHLRPDDLHSEEPADAA